MGIPSKSNFDSSIRRRCGLAVSYYIVALPVMLGVVSLGVDVARCQLAKSILRHTAQAAALAAADQLQAGSAAAIANAIAAAAPNLVEGTPVALNSTNDIQFVNWVSPGNYTVLSPSNFSQANAVQVFARRTRATGNGIPLIFGAIIGFKTCDVTQSAIALLSLQSTTQTVKTTSDPWLAGEPTGTIGSVTDSGWQGNGVNPVHPWQHDIAGPNGSTMADGQLYDSPVLVNITVTPGSVITLTNVSGQGSNDPTLPMYNADGTSSAGISVTYDWAATGSVPQEHGMSDILAPHNSILGVFLTNNTPDNPSTVAPELDFTTQTARDYTSFSPQLQQVFYAGTGLTSAGKTQSFLVPQGATRLYLGTMDGHEWSNNVGGYSATITQKKISIVQ